MADEKKTKKSTNVTHLKTVSEKRKLKKERNMLPKGSPVRPKTKSDIFITDDRFKHAMELIRQDMNNALSLGQTANSQFYFLFQFLVKNGIINEEVYKKFLNEELDKVQSDNNSKSGEK